MRQQTTLWQLDGWAKAVAHTACAKEFAADCLWIEEPFLCLYQVISTRSLFFQIKEGGSTSRKLDYQQQTTRVWWSRVFWSTVPIGVCAWLAVCGSQGYY